MIHLENTELKISINPKGAELSQIYSKATNLDYMWNADANFWAKSSPVLFPIVGGLKDNSYIFEDKKYTLPRHGFARDLVFEVEENTDEKAIFLLKYNNETLEKYPFKFELRLIYTLEKSTLTVTYQLNNVDSKTLYFSVGGHPAFAVPIDKSLAYNDYYLAFNQNEKLERHLLNADGLTSTEIRIIENIGQNLPLNHELFYDDALVFKHLESDEIVLKSEKSMHFLRFTFKDFPFFGIWAAKNANFVCLEPWCGIADSENHNQKLTEKEGINELAPNQTFSRSWSVEVG